MSNYQDGRQDPWGHVDITKPGAFEYQQGQYDEAKRISDDLVQMHTSGGASSTALLRNPGKSVLMGILLTALFGPLGLFYASKKGALAMLAAWFGLSMLMSLPGTSPAAQPAAPLAALWMEVAFQVVWPLAALGSMVWSAIAVIAHNKKLAKLD